MAVRFSNPSGSLGVDRFKVWPNKTTDSYNTTDLTGNWDLLDSMIGVPSGGTAWPPTTGIDGGIYREVKILQDERTPIGTIIPWWRPNDSITIPAGFVECIGQVLNSSQHNFSGGGSITLPDLRNKFMLGADSTFTRGTAETAVGSGNIDAASGAPGLGYIGGSNQILMSIAQLPAHNHGGGAHDHGGGNHSHTYTDNGHFHSFNRQVLNLNTGSTPYLINVRDSVTNSENTLTATIGISINGSGTIIPSVANVASQGSGSPIDNRPGHVGLIFLMKVLYITTP